MFVDSGILCVLCMAMYEDFLIEANECDSRNYSWKVFLSCICILMPFQHEEEQGLNRSDGKIKQIGIFYMQSDCNQLKNFCNW